MVRILDGHKPTRWKQSVSEYNQTQDRGTGRRGRSIPGQLWQAILARVPVAAAVSVLFSTSNADRQPIQVHLHNNMPLLLFVAVRSTAINDQAAVEAPRKELLLHRRPSVDRGHAVQQEASSESRSNSNRMSTYFQRSPRFLRTVPAESAEERTTPRPRGLGRSGRPFRWS